MLIDAEGRPTTSVDAYYGPRAGAMVAARFPPERAQGLRAFRASRYFGRVAFRGRDDARSARAHRQCAVHRRAQVAAFLPLDEFYAEVAGFVEWVKSCPPAPGVAEVLLPGERAHQRLRRRGSAMVYTWMRRLGPR